MPDRRTLEAIDHDLANATPNQVDDLLDERLQATGPLRPSQVLANTSIS